MNNNDYMAEALSKLQGGDQESSLNNEEAQKQETVEEQTTKTEPVAEEPVQSEQQKEQVEATPEVQTDEVPTIDRDKLFQEMLVEKTGGKFNNWEELTQMTEQPTKTELDERLSEIQEYLNKGGSFEDFILSQATDYDSLNDLELVKEKMLVDNPEMDESDADFLLARKYKLNDENFDEDEVRLSKIELKAAAKEAKNTLKEMQDKLRLPEAKQSITEDIQKQQAAQQAQAQQQREQWLKSIETSVPELKDVSFKVNDQEFRHVVTDEQRENIGKLNSDLNTFFAKYQREDGSVDMKTLNSDRYKLEYFDQIMRSAVSQAKATGTENIVNEIKNPSVSSQAQTTDSKPKSIEDQVRDVIYRDILR